MSLTIEVAGKSDVGCVRKNNEDNFGYDTRYGIFVVCDGMGGQAAGEVASKMSVDVMLDFFRQNNGSLPPDAHKFEGVSERANALGNAIAKANATVYQASRKGRSEHAGMGSTIASVLLRDKFLSVGHVGDSRVYLIREDQIQQLTNDHSLVMEQVRRGLMTQQEAEKSEIQNIILRALGSEEKVEPDLQDVICQPNDVLLLASDGLTKLVNDKSILAIVQHESSLQRACEQLVETAKKQGGDDNITCLLVRLVELPWYRRIFSRKKGSQQWQNSI
ncbi:MAG TPA: Stp1/IreP family PP2C-type Ser/Thr phosphatase [Terriglobales bacterium]|jgi:serine/threonine protein phosphatase PrpC|nr:Stp1/IreP family PP2C-type Ser/Thr phosphatase [Terriglobales bacterium]